MAYGSLPATTPSFGSREVNGQLVPVFMGSVFAPGNGVGPRLYGYGVNTPQTIPVTPGSASGAAGLPALGGTALHLTPRTAIVLSIMFVAGFLGLRYIHWRA